VAFLTDAEQPASSPEQQVDGTKGAEAAAEVAQEQPEGEKVSGEEAGDAAQSPEATTVDNPAEEGLGGGKKSAEQTEEAAAASEESAVPGEESASGEPSAEAPVAPNPKEAPPKKETLDLEDAIAWMKRRIELYIPEMKEFDEESTRTLSDFFSDSQVDTIFVFMEALEGDKLQSRIQRAAPLMENVQVFIRTQDALCLSLSQAAT
jgi:hypothetical protein